MAGKSDRTSQFIIETVAPVFNKMGYVGTSMAQLTKATGLTKGAIYGNFESKEHLAVEAFNYNVRRVIGLMAEEINSKNKALDKLHTITAFYRRYYEFTVSFGGCPILNVGVDSNYLNPLLKNRVVEVIHKLKANISNIISEGIANGEFRKDLNVDRMALTIFSIIEGGVFTSVILNDPEHLIHVMNHLDDLIKEQIVKEE